MMKSCSKSFFFLSLEENPHIHLVSRPPTNSIGMFTHADDILAVMCPLWWYSLQLWYRTKTTKRRDKNKKRRTKEPSVNGFCKNWKNNNNANACTYNNQPSGIAVGAVAWRIMILHEGKEDGYDTNKVWWEWWSSTLPSLDPLILYVRWLER
jgi:hypothetical protein